MRIVGPFLSREDIGQFTRVVLKNRLTVLLFERTDTPMVAMVTYVKAGQLHQEDSQKGFSEVWAPLLFRSQVPGRKGTVAQEARRAGALIDAGAQQDHIWFSAILPADRYRRGLDLHVTALHGLNSSMRLEQAHRVAQHQSTLRLANPEHFSRQQLLELAFPGGRGLAQGIDREVGRAAIGEAEFKAFHNQWFVPENTLLTVTGSFDRRALLREVVKRYQAIPGQKVAKLPAYSKSRPDGFSYANRQGDIHQAWVQIGFALPAAFSKDWYACKVLEAVLTRGETAVLNRHLGSLESRIRPISSRYQALEHLGFLNLTLALEGRQLDRAVVVTLAGIERVKAGFLEESDLGRARALLEAEHHQGQEVLLDLAMQLSRYEHLSGFGAWAAYLEKIGSVTRQEVISAAQRYLNLEQCSLLEYQPLSIEKRTFSSQSYRDFLQLALPRFTRALGQEDVVEIPLPEKAGQAEVGRPRRKDPNEISSAGLIPPLRKFSVLRGPDVWVQERPQLPLTVMGIFFPGGSLFEDPQNHGITSLMASTALRAGRSPAASHPARLFESLGVAVEVVVKADFFGFVLQGLSHSFGFCVDTLLETLQRPNFEEEAIITEKLNLRFQASARLDDPRQLVRRLFLQAAYPGHPYGRWPDGSSASLEKITRRDLVKWHRRYVVESNPVVVIVGDVEGSAFAARFASKWRRSGGSGVELATALKVPRPTAPRHKQGKGKQSHPWLAEAGFLGPAAADPRVTTLTVLQHLTSGVGGTLPLLLEDRQDAVDTIITSHRRRALGGFFYAYLAAAPDKGQQALKGVKSHLVQIATGPMPEEALTQAKQLAAATYRIATQSRRKHMLELAESAILGHSIYEINNYLKEIEAVDSEAVRELAREFFNPELWIAGVVAGCTP